MLRRVGRDDRRALLVLLAIPVVVFGVPALFGHPIVTGDNQIQNLPLRVLAGRDLRHGHLPLWNPYIWSGSPLLGGLNAGALYPFTWLFAILPISAAWTINLIVVYVTAAFGLYVLLRQQGLRAFSSGFGAASFAFAGSMSAQIVHLGIVQGTSWIPLMLVVEQRLNRQLRGIPEGEAGRSPSVGRRVVLLGFLGGLVLLTGEPRAMANAAVVVGLAAAWYILGPGSPWRARLMLGASVALAGLVAIAIGAIQLFPGWSFISDSQRAHSTVAFFGSGSLAVRWTLLQLVPDLLGGTGPLNQPRFFAHYNLPEVTGYVGVLPLMAVGGLLARSFGRRRHSRAAAWLPWIGLVVIGLALAYGTYTPLGRVFLAHIPFFGKLRLQSRNLVIFDLGLCVLLAYWLDLVAEGTTSSAGGRLTRLATVLPAAAVSVVCLVGVAFPARIEAWMGVLPDAVHLGRALTPSLIALLVVTLSAGAMGLAWHRFNGRQRKTLLGGVLVVDLLLFSVTSVNGLALGFTTAHLPTPSTAVPVGPGHKFAIYDPHVEDPPGLLRIGQTDVNVLLPNPSVQGYGSITDNHYQANTGTRLDNQMSPCALASGTFVSLDLRTIVTLSDHLVHDDGTTPEPPSTVVPVRPPPCGASPATTSNRRTWWFGRALSVRSATVLFDGPAPSLPGMRVGTLTGTGTVHWTPASVTSDGQAFTLAFPTRTIGFGLVLDGPGSGRSVDASTVTTVSGRRYTLDGDLQEPLRVASFKFTGMRDEFSVFRTNVALGPVWVEQTGSQATTTRTVTSVGTARQTHVTSWGTETDEVTASRPVTLVRSQAFAGGWRATVLDVKTHETRAVKVRRIGLVQGINLPAGRFTVTWTYLPAPVMAGLLASLAGGVVVLAAAASWFWRRRVRGRTQVVGQAP